MNPNTTRVFTKAEADVGTEPLLKNTQFKDRTGQTFGIYTVYSFAGRRGYGNGKPSWWCVDKNKPGEYLLLTSSVLMTSKITEDKKEIDEEIRAERKSGNGLFFMRRYSNDRFRAFQITATQVGAVDDHGALWIPLPWIRSVDTSMQKTLTNTVYGNKNVRRLVTGSVLDNVTHQRSPSPRTLLLNVDDVLECFKLNKPHSNDNRDWSRRMVGSIENLTTEIQGMIHGVKVVTDHVADEKIANTPVVEQPKPEQQVGLQQDPRIVVHTMFDKAAMDFFNGQGLKVSLEVFNGTSAKLRKKCYDNPAYAEMMSKMNAIAVAEFSDDIKVEALVSIIKEK